MQEGRGAKLRPVDGGVPEQDGQLLFHSNVASGSMCRMWAR
jgi:hypothetical protein